MKHLFAISFILMGLFTLALHQTSPQTTTGAPVLYWTTDPNPIRISQVKGFHDWLVAEGHVTAAGSPVTRLELDAANNNPSKKIIQGVSGVGSDIWDIYGGAPRLTYYHAMGLLDDVTDAAAQLGYDPSRTYPAILPEITVDGRQYTFPCNVTTPMLWVNKATFRKYGQPIPPTRWTLQEFERRGKAFVAAANPPGQRHTVFFCERLDIMILHRSLGLSRYNETLTRCTLDDERFTTCLALLRKWTNQDHLLPSAADRAGFDTQSGYGGAAFQLFNAGNYATVSSGRYALIQFRKFGALELAVVEPPHGGLPNTLIATRAAGVYFLGRHKQLARLFQAYLASESYNAQIVRDADALPPNPRFARTEAFSRPPQYPNEWGCHDAFYNAAMQIAVGHAVSPFVLDQVADRHVGDALHAVLADQLLPAQAAERATYRINREIERSVAEDPALARRYEQRLAIQKKIDAMRADDQLVPLDMIANPFHRRRYQIMQWSKPAP